MNNIRPGLIYNKQLQIMGTVMGTPKEFGSMLGFYSEHKLQPVLDREFSLENIQAAAEYMQTAQHFGKIMLKVK